MKNDTEMLTEEQTAQLLRVLQARFLENMHRHATLLWDDLQAKLQANPAKLRALYEMESTGGEPDAVGFDTQTMEYVFFDCAAESPVGRRNLCYDEEALNARKANKPAGSAVGMAAFMGADILSEEQYRSLQLLGAFDVKTSSWIQTPKAVRRLGGALFCDRRYNQVFVYHNGAESYYSVRGFRAALRV